MTIRWVSVILGLLAALPLAAAEPQWRELKTPRFTVLSQVSDARTRRWATEFNEFIDTAQVMMQIPDTALPPPLTVIIFDADAEFAKYRPNKDNGKVAKLVVASTIRTPTWSLSAFSAADGSEQTRRMLFQGGTYWLSDAAPGAKPTWVMKGMGEMLSTFATQGDSVHFADPIDTYLRVLRDANLMPLDKLMMQRTSVLADDHQTLLFDAQSWGLAHYLLLGDAPGNREKWIKYLNLYQTRTAETAARQAFGEDLSGLLKQLEVYARRSRFTFLKLPRPAARPVADPVPAPPLHVQLALGKFALEAADTSLAPKHLQAAAALDPQAAGVFELQTDIAKRDKDRIAAVSAARRALIAGSTDASVYLLLASDLQSNDMAADPDRWLRSADLAAQAINVNSRVPASYALLLRALDRIPKPPSEYRDFVELGRKVFPQDGDLTLGSARLSYKLGRVDEALSTLDAAMGEGSNLDLLQMETARQLRSQWAKAPAR
jgi:hypothetical protein